MKILMVGIVATTALGVLGVLFTPSLTLAQEATEGLVACTGVDCNFCSLMETGYRVINLLFQLLIIGAVVMVVVAGFKLVTSAGNVSAMQGAKEMLTNVIIGFVIVLAAWLIVDTIYKMLVGENTQFGMWNKFEASQCGGLKNTSTQPTAGPTHEQIREQIRAENPNVGSEYTLGPGENYGSPGHTTYVKNCIDSGGSVAQKLNSNNTLECRFPSADSVASGGNNLYCYATQGQGALTCVQTLSECERFNALATGGGQIVSGCFAQARPQN